MPPTKSFHPLFYNSIAPSWVRLDEDHGISWMRFDSDGRLQARKNWTLVWGLFRVTESNLFIPPPIVSNGTMAAPWDDDNVRPCMIFDSGGLLPDQQFDVSPMLLSWRNPVSPRRCHLNRPRKTAVGLSRLPLDLMKCIVKIY